MAFSRGIEGSPISNTSVAAIPNTATAVTAKRAKVWGFFLSNPTGGALVVSIRDGGTSGTVVMAISVPANSSGIYPTNININTPLIFPSGLSWSAASTGMFGEVIGTYAPA